jgi:acyl-homoserine-lactone acylase
VDQATCGEDSGLRCEATGIICHYGRVRMGRTAVVGLLLAAACSPGEGPQSIPLPTSPDTTTTTSTTTTTTTTTLVPPRYEAEIRRTTNGVPHITGNTPADVAYGQGWASGEDHGCTLIDQILKVTGSRSAALGPGAEGENVDGDFAWRAIGIAEIAAADFENASSDVTEQFEAFTAGWNDQLADVGGDRLTGWCSGADWIRPITAVEVYSYARSIALQASSSAIIDFIGSARPPAAEPAAMRRRSGMPRESATIDLDEFAAAELGLVADDGLASNGWAIGKDRVVGNEGGLLLANPHFPWEGELRFTEVQLTVPGRADVYGAQLLGLPGVGIGFTEGVAWTHTVSAGKRMTGYLLSLDPASPTSYLVDGQSVPMTSTDASIDILRPDGTVDTETRTLWRSEYGPIIDFPGIGWTDTSVLSFRDANLDNDEFIEQYARMPEIQSIADLQALTAEYQGVPLFNTVAVGDDGATWYADTSATPNLSAEAELAYIGKLFTDPLTQIAYDQGFVLLDGSDSRFRWETVDGARDPGLVPFSDMPMVQRTDYVFNANDSFWIPSAEFTLAGAYSILHGEQNTPLSMRTRQNAAVLGSANGVGLAGPDGLFDADEVRTAAFDNTGMTAVLLRAAAVDACRTTPIVDVAELLAADGSVSLPAASIDLTAACDVLASWDGVYDLDRSGPMVWRETMSRFDPAAFETAGALFDDVFDPAQPTVTPAVPAAGRAPLLQAMARAVQTMTVAGFGPDTTLGASQFTERSGTRIPIHGGSEVDGVTNIVTWSNRSSSSEPAPQRGVAVAAGSSMRGEGYRINYGTSFVMAVDYTGDDVQAWALLVYGQTLDRSSPLFDSQTVEFSQKQWRQVAFTDSQIAADPNLETYTVIGR